MKFIKKIFSPACLSISLLILIYTFYKSEIYHDGLRDHFYLPIYIVSIFLIIFSIITFFLNHKIKEYLIIATISIMASSYIVETYLIIQHIQLVKDQPFLKQKRENEKIIKKQLYEKKTGKKYETKTRLEIYEDLLKINDKIKVAVTPREHLSGNHKIVPLSGISNSKTIHCNENGYYSIYQSDRYGFNNPDEEWDNSEIEYLLIGDSFTHGACVNRPNDIASVLRALSIKPVLNLGFSNNNALIEYATLREYLNPNIKKVIWIYFINDINFNHELNNKILKNYLKDLSFTQNLKSKQKDINILVNAKIEDARKKQTNYLKNLPLEKEKKKEKESFKSKFIKFIKFYNLRFILFPLEKPPPISEFKQILKLTKDLTNKNNSKLYFVYLESYKSYKEKKIFNNHYKLIKNIVNELDIPFIDIHNEVFKKERNPLKLFPFGFDGHYNIRGYKKTAETIYEHTSD